MRVKCFLLILLSLLVVGGITIAFWKISETKKPLADDTLVKINNGFVRGRQRVTQIKNKKYFSFQGIPYAKPPIGPLRFKDPQPSDSWNDREFDATKEGNICLQQGQGSEDCLFINVYNTKFQDDNNELPQPVMVYIHGGGFVAGSGNEERLGPDFLLENDVVVVTFNYRLGVFGFLSLENGDIPGNAGLKDQVLALEWVQHNIKQFGGNPNNVTIFGESAGGASVHYQILSSLSPGLFQAAIIQSGVANNPWTIQSEPIRRAFMAGSLLGNNATTVEGLTEFLRNVSALDLEKIQWNVKSDTSEARCLEFPFNPSIEKDTAGKHFILEHPQAILKAGNFNKVPIMIGTVDKEGGVLLFDLAENHNLVSDFRMFIPANLKLKNDSQEYKELENKIKKFYFHDKPINVEESLPEITEICGDLDFLIGIHQTINYTLQYSQFPVYVYQFSFDGKYGYYKQAIKTKWLGSNVTLPSGTYHADDVGYLFNGHVETIYYTFSQDFKMVKSLTDAWTNFAKYHNPNFKNESEWQRTERGSPKYLHFDDPTKLENTHLSPNRMKMWDEIYAKYG